MTRGWLSIRVELLGGRGEQLWPYPGRVFAVGPAHTFADLAGAIDNAFARWDRSHLSLFTLSDGRVVTDGKTGSKFEASAFGVVPAGALDIGVAKVMGTLETGAQFRYVFDLGDDWIHCCTVETAHVDPEKVLGLTPQAPTGYLGWGSMPDQYGRRWAQDEGQGSAPSRPRQPHAMLDGGWPDSGERPPLVDVDLLRGAAASGDVAGIVAALQGHDVSEVLQRAGSAVQVALRTAPERVSSLAISLVQRLEVRNLPGDEELAQDLLAGSHHPGSLCPLTSRSCRGCWRGTRPATRAAFWICGPGQ
jgi:Plasmid pRiA4b ORF-3-like protein